MSNDEIQIAELEAEIEIMYNMMASDRPAVVAEAIVTAVEKLAPDQTLSDDIETMSEIDIAAEIDVEELIFLDARDAALRHILDGMDAGERRAAFAEYKAWDARHADKRKYLKELCLAMERKGE